MGLGQHGHRSQRGLLQEQRKALLVLVISQTLFLRKGREWAVSGR